jgi:hypothetical protein
MGGVRNNLGGVRNNAPLVACGIVALSRWDNVLLKRASASPLDVSPRFFCSTFFQVIEEFSEDLS